MNGIKVGGDVDALPKCIFVFTTHANAIECINCVARQNTDERNKDERNNDERNMLSGKRMSGRNMRAKTVVVHVGCKI